MTKYILFFSFLFLFSCTKEEPTDTTGNSNNSWLVPETELVFGTNKDAIRSVDAPQFSSIEEISFMQEDDRVLVLNIENEVRAYPLNILDWHEIVNDQIGEKNVAITYCPLTGSGICWNREIDNQLITFGVSGWLYNSNLIAFDRETDSYWSQMRTDCINGNFVGRTLPYYHMIEMSWASLKDRLPEVKVLNGDTGFDLPYTDYPYYDYPTNNNFFVVPIEFEDTRYPSKEQMLGVNVLGEVKAYPFSIFDPNQVTIINDIFKGQPIVVICQPNNGFATAYKSNLDGTTLQFSAVQEGGSIVMEDHLGNQWNILGQDEAGKQLRTVKAYTAYWFAWLEFFPFTEIYE